MRSFLSQPDASLFHITTSAKWEKIQKSALNSDSQGRIFVSRSDEEAVLYSIALTQLAGLEDEVDLVVLKLPHSLNNFEVSEFSYDTNATEIAMPFQSILLRAEIPLTQLFLHRPIQTTILELGRISNGFLQRLPNDPLYQDALGVIYEPKDKEPYKISANNEAGIWIFKTQQL